MQMTIVSMPLSPGAPSRMSASVHRGSGDREEAAAAEDAAPPRASPALRKSRRSMRHALPRRRRPGNCGSNSVSRRGAGRVSPRGRTLVGKEPALAFDAAAVAAERTVGPHHTVARHDDAHRVRHVGAADQRVMHPARRSPARCRRTRRSRRPGSAGAPPRRAVGTWCREHRPRPRRSRRPRRRSTRRARREPLVVAALAGGVDEPGFAHHAVVGDDSGTNRWE